jgi:endoglucanase
VARLAILLVVVSAAVLFVGTLLLFASGPAATGADHGQQLSPQAQARAQSQPTSLSSSPPAVQAVAPPAGATSHAADQAFSAAASFLDRYEERSGRVVRWDQGGDTVSEGEAYAMLLSVATGDRSRFDAAWGWTRAHLLLPSGLLAWHWANGRVTSTEPAADADVDAAYALELAASRFGERADVAPAAAMASAIVSDESVAAPSGRILVAGPWALGPPAYANPSYASPAELTALGALVTDPQDFTALAQGSRVLVGQLLDADKLPPDWVQLSPAAGPPVVVAPPGQEGSDDYGFDAVRLPIRWGASCDVADRRAVAMLWPSLGRAALAGRPSIDLTLAAGRSRAALQAPVGLVAAAAAGWAAGHREDARALLNRAETANHAHPTYYSSAWVALGRMFLQTRRLGSCGSSGA